MCRTFDRTAGGSARFADPKGATEWRPNGLKKALRKLRVPLVLQRRIFTLCTKVHALLLRKNPCLEAMKSNVFLPTNHVLTGHSATGDDIRFGVCWQVDQKKNNNFGRLGAARATGKPVEIHRRQARNPLIESLPVRGLASTAKFGLIAPECRELRRYTTMRLKTPSCRATCSYKGVSPLMYAVGGLSGPDSSSSRCLQNSAFRPWSTYSKPVLRCR